MTKSLDSISLVRHYQTSREALWKRLSTESLRSHWWPHSILELRAGGIVASPLYRLDGTQNEQLGLIDVFVDGESLGFSWRRLEDRHETSVLVTLTSRLESTQLSILEVGFRTLPNASNRINEARQHWNHCLDALTDAIAGPVTQRSVCSR